MKIFWRILQAGGIIIFCIAVFITVLFAEGYQFDFKKKDFVKRGVIYFEDIPRDAQVFLDNQQVDMEFSNEVRVSPGEHDLLIKKDEFFDWMKHVNVSQENVLSFRAIKLFSVSNSTQTFESSKNVELQSFSEKGVFLFNKKLSFGKFYDLSPHADFWIRDIPLNFGFHNLIPVSDEEFIGLTNDSHIFYYDADNQKTYVSENQTAKQLESAGDNIFALSPDGKIFLLKNTDSGSKINQELFFGLPVEIKKISRVMETSENYILFVLDTAVGRVLAVANKDGSIVFQQGGDFGGAFADENFVYFTVGKKLFVYDLEAKKNIKQYPLNEEFIWLSRIEESEHFLFLTKSLELVFCDEDGENCHKFAKLDSDRLASSKNAERFFGLSENVFTLFDFGEQKSLPQLLEDLVSGVFGKISL